jgi:hypothetical protein
MVPHLPWPRGEWLRDHWRWWPEWTSERPRVLWYLAFQHRPEVARFGARTSEELRRARCVDVVPDRWLHLTLCDIGFVDEVGPDRLDAAAEAVTEALGDQPPIRLTLGPAVTLPDASCLPRGRSRSCAACRPA